MHGLFLSTFGLACYEYFFNSCVVCRIHLFPQALNLVANFSLNTFVISRSNVLNDIQSFIYNCSLCAGMQAPDLNDHNQTGTCCHTAKFFMSKYFITTQGEIYHFHEFEKEKDFAQHSHKLK